MGFLARRSPGPPVPAAAAAAPSPAAVTSARLNWQHDRPFGWQAVPERARLVLAAAGWATADPLAASSYEPTTRRDPSGRYWRDTDAWWINQDSLLLVRVREALTHLGTGPDGRPRLRRRRGGGKLQLTTHPLTGPPPTAQRWSRPPHTSAAAGGHDPGVRFTDTSTELLPRAVQDELGRPTGQVAIRNYPEHGGYYDQVYAYRRVSPAELLVVTAVREAGAYPDPDTAIDAADWHITTYRPQVGAASESVLAM